MQPQGGQDRRCRRHTRLLLHQPEAMGLESMARKSHTAHRTAHARDLPLRARMVCRARLPRRLCRQPLRGRDRCRTGSSTAARGLPPRAPSPRQAHNSPASRQPPRRSARQPARDGTGRPPIRPIPARSGRRTGPRRRLLRLTHIPPYCARRHLPPPAPRQSRSRHQRHSHPRGSPRRHATGGVLPLQRLQAISKCPTTSCAASSMSTTWRYPT